MPSPFTRVGPGPASIVKPDLVYYGGNAGVENGKIVINGVPSLWLRGCFNSSGNDRTRKIRTWEEQIRHWGSWCLIWLYGRNKYLGYSDIYKK